MYNDYPILNDDEYFKLLNQYNAANSYNHTQTVADLYVCIERAINFCIGLTNTNKKLEAALKTTHTTLTTILENIKITFNINLKSTNSVEEFNVFYLLKTLTTACQHLQQIQQKAEKDYHKIFANKTLSTILDIINQIINILSCLNIHIYKYI